MIITETKCPLSVFFARKRASPKMRAGAFALGKRGGRVSPSGPDKEKREAKHRSPGSTVEQNQHVSKKEPEKKRKLGGSAHSTRQRL